MAVNDNQEREHEERPEPLVLSVVEAAGMLGISKDLAYELVARGELPSLRLGRRIVIPTKRLIELVASA